jgi:hypothetical protein
MHGWLRRHWTLLLLDAVPAAAALEFFAPERHTAIFFTSVAAIVPLAGCAAPCSAVQPHWIEGVQLLGVYAILVLGFYFLPRT